MHVDALEALADTVSAGMMLTLLTTSAMDNYISTNSIECLSSKKDQIFQIC